MRAISGAISQAMAPIHRKLASLESRIGDSASAYSGTSGGRPGSSRGAETATSSCDTQRALYSWLMPKERPIFPSKGMTPITFLSDLRRYIEKTNSFGRELEVVQECLTGEAKVWTRLFKNNWSNLDDFENDFRTYFWGEAHQSDISRKIAQGTWKAEEGRAMAPYFIELWDLSQSLTRPMAETHTVNEIMRHFPKEVRYLWFSGGRSTAIEAVGLLTRLETMAESGQSRGSGLGADRKSPVPKRNGEAASNSFNARRRNVHAITVGDADTDRKDARQTGDERVPDQNATDKGVRRGREKYIAGNDRRSKWSPANRPQVNE